MLDAVFSTSGLLALMFAAGLFVLLIGTQWTSPVKLSNVENLYGEGRSQPAGPFASLQARLDAAGFGISAGDFLKVVAVLVVLVFVVAYLVVGALAPALLCALMSAFGYWIYLGNKATKAIEDYEEQLPQLVSRLVVGARMGNSLRGAAEHAANFGPPLCRDDWTYICRQMDAGADLEMICRVVSARRQSQLLNSIFELLLVQHQRGTPISDVMPLIQESLTQRARTVRLARTKLNGPLRELYVICASPFAAVAVMRFSDPQFATMYAQPLGQLIVTLVFLIDIGLFFWLRRMFSNDLRRETNFYGDLKAQPRTALAETQPAGRRMTAGTVRPLTEPLDGHTPSSLARLLGPRPTVSEGTATEKQP